MTVSTKRVRAVLDSNGYENRSAGDVRAIQALFHEYWVSFGFTPCFQGFEDEVAGLPGKYAPPAGRLGLAVADGGAAGCIALRPVDENRGEVKRLYVRPEFRGLGWGRELLLWVIEEARGIGYGELLADTMPVMGQALAMYERTGFEHCAPYLAEPTADAICLRLRL